MAEQSLPSVGLSLPRLRQGYRLVVVGGNGGIGAALCELAGRHSAAVTALDTGAAIAERPLSPGIDNIAMDVRDPHSVGQAFADIRSRSAPIDGLVYLSGVFPPRKPFHETTLDEWDRVLDINLRGAFIVIKQAAALMAERDAAIVMVSSGLATHVEPGFGAYSASKAGLIALAKVLAKELAPAVRVNTVAPGLVDTPLLTGGTGQDRSATPPSDSDLLAKVGQTSLLGRIAVPDDIIGPLMFLLSDSARYMTGQTIYVNAGRYMP